MFSKRSFRASVVACLSGLLLACGAGSGDDLGLFPLWINTDVLIADLDGDGRPDVLTVAQLATNAGQREGRLQVRLQTAPGVFLPPQSYSVGTYPWRMALADLDGDGLPDLVITDVGNPASSTDRAVWLLRQNTSQRGQFLTPQRLTLSPSRPYDVALGDLNGDNLPDIVVADSPPGGTGATVLYQSAVLRGTFLPPALIALPGDATGVALGDLNGDGRLDLVSRVSLAPTNLVPNNTLAIRYQQAGGALAPAVALNPQTGLISQRLTLTDYNADGVRDGVEFFTASSTAYQAKVTTLLQSNPAGTFATVDTSLSGVNGLDSGVVADLNGDGRADFASVGAYPVGSPSTIASTLNLLLQNGAGGFALSASITLPIAATRLAAGDVNGDGLLDLVLLGSNHQVLLLLQSASVRGSFLAPVFLN